MADIKKIKKGLYIPNLRAGQMNHELAISVRPTS